MRRRKSRGSSLIEATFILMTLLAVLIGSLDIAKVVYLHQSLVERARAGAQWAAVNDFNATQVKNYVVYNSPAGGTTASLWRLQTSMVTAELKDQNTSKARVEIKITDYPYDFFTPWIAGAYKARPIVTSVIHEPSLP